MPKYNFQPLSNTRAGGITILSIIVIVFLFMMIMGLCTSCNMEPVKSYDVTPTSQNYYIESDSLTSYKFENDVHVIKIVVFWFEGHKYMKVVNQESSPIHLESCPCKNH